MSFLFVFSFVFCLIFKIPLNKFNDNYYNGVSKKKKKKKKKKNKKKKKKKAL